MDYFFKGEKMKKFILIIMALLLFTGCNQQEDNRVYDKYNYHFFGTFDTVVSTVMYAENEDKANEYNEYIERRFNELHKEFSKYNDYEGVNNVKTINDNAGINPVEVSDELFNLIKSSIEYSNEYTDNTDISFGAVLQVWSDYRDINEVKDSNVEYDESELLPSLELLQEKNQYTGMEHIILDEENKTVYIDNENTQIDVGATAKGFAVELICEEVREMGMDSLLVSAGGNVKAVGYPLDGIRGAWGVGIQNPDILYPEENQSNLVETLFVKDLSVVTSGDYQRFFNVNGKTYHHLIDTETLFPGEYFRSVSVIHEDSGLADFLSTSLFLMPYEEGKELIDSIDGSEAMWINMDGSIVVTEGLKEIMLSEGASGAK